MLYINRKARTVVLVILFAGVLLISGMYKNKQLEAPANEESSDTGKGDENMDLQIIKVFSSAFESNSTIPRKYTCDGGKHESASGIHEHS